MMIYSAASCGSVTALTLGLPSTTTVPSNRANLTKEEFYNNTHVSKRLRRHFVDDIDTITMLAVIQEAKTGIASGKTTQEIEVIGLLMKTDSLPLEVMDHIARTRDDVSNHTSHVFFVCVFGNECTLAVFRNANVAEGLAFADLYTGTTTPAAAIRLSLQGNNLDVAWDSLCSQVIFHNARPEHVDRRIVRRKRIMELITEKERLSKAHAKTDQIAKRNELWPKIQQVEAELKELQGAEQ